MLLVGISAALSDVWRRFSALQLCLNLSILYAEGVKRCEALWCFFESTTFSDSEYLPLADQTPCACGSRVGSLALVRGTSV